MVGLGLEIAVLLWQAAITFTFLICVDKIVGMERGFFRIGILNVFALWI